VLLSESAGLAAVLTRLLDRRDQLVRIGWSREVAEQGECDDADLVVLDVPRADRIAAVDRLRRRYRGPVVVFVERGEDGRRLPPDQARTLLARPFSADELEAALGLSEPGTREDRAMPGGSRDAAGRRPLPIRPTLYAAPHRQAAAARRPRRSWRRGRSWRRRRPRGPRRQGSDPGRAPGGHRRGRLDVPATGRRRPRRQALQRRVGGQARRA
jgi:CheY-like chemotaxis protein